MTVSNTPNLDTLQQGIENLVTTLVANHKANSGNVQGEIISDIEPVLSEVKSAISNVATDISEARLHPLSALRALINCGFDIAINLSGK